MIIKCSKTSDFPKCPKNAYPQTYTIKYVGLKMNPYDNDYPEFGILSSKKSATGFVIREYLSDFPPAASQNRLNLYNDDPDYYRQEMTNYQLYGGDELNALCEKNDLFLYIYYSNGKFLDAGDWFDKSDIIKASTQLLKAANNVEMLFWDDGYEGAMYGGFLEWEPDESDYIDGMWRTSDRPCSYVDGSYSDYEWIKVYNTEIMVPPWAESKKDFMKITGIR